MKLLAIAALTSLAAAAPADETSPTTYVMHSRSSTSQFNGLEVTSYHIAAGESYAVLMARNASLPNGGAEPLTLQNRVITFLAGNKGSVKEGLVIPGNAQPMEINAGAGTKGFYVEKTSGIQKQISFSNSSAFFYACPNSNLPYGTAIQLSYASSPIPLASDCGEVDLWISPAH